MTKERVCANSPAMSRRTMMKVLPVSAAAALPCLGAAQGSDPTVALYRKWLKARREWSELAGLPGNENWDAPWSVALQTRETALEDEMFRTPPVSLEGIAALAAVAWYWCHPGVLDPEEYEQAAQAPECQAIMAIWKACTGKDGYPEV